MERQENFILADYSATKFIDNEMGRQSPSVFIGVQESIFIISSLVDNEIFNKFYSSLNFSKGSPSN